MWTLYPEIYELKNFLLRLIVFFVVVIVSRFIPILRKKYYWVSGISAILGQLVFYWWYEIDFVDQLQKYQEVREQLIVMVIFCCVVFFAILKWFDTKLSMVIMLGLITIASLYIFVVNKEFNWKYTGSTPTKDAGTLCYSGFMCESGICNSRSNDEKQETLIKSGYCRTFSDYCAPYWPIHFGIQDEGRQICLDE